MTWREILLDAKKQNHNISVDKLINEAQDRLLSQQPIKSKYLPTSLVA
jgi:hypothetical protein